MDHTVRLSILGFLVAGLLGLTPHIAYQGQQLQERLGLLLQWWMIHVNCPRYSGLSGCSASAALRHSGIEDSQSFAAAIN